MAGIGRNSPSQHELLLNDLHRILLLLDSSKSRDRLSAVESLKVNLTESASSLKPEVWRVVCDKLVACIEIHIKNAKKPADEAVIAGLANDLKWVVERAKAASDDANVLHLALTNPLLDHVIKYMFFLAQGRELPYRPVVLAYSRMLRLLLSHKPYRQHLGYKAWIAVLNTTTNLLKFRIREIASCGTAHAVFAPEMMELAKVFNLLVISCPKDLLICSQGLIDFITEFILSYPKDTPCTHYLLQSLNFILWECSPDNLDSTLFTLSSLVPKLLSLYENKTTNLKLQLIYLFRSYLALAGSCFIERAENRLSRGLIDESIIYGFQENVAVLFDKLQHDLSMNIRSKSSSNSTAASSLSNFGLVRIDDILPLLDIKDRCVDWSSPLFYEDDSSELLSGNKDLTLQIILFEYAAQVFYMSIIIQKYRRDSSTAVAATSSISLASDSSSSKPNSSSQAVSSHPSDTMLVFNVEEDGFTPMLEDSVPLNAPELSSSSSFQHPAKKRRRTTALDVICSALISQDYSSSNLSENTMRVLVFFYSNSEITSNIHEICTPSVLKTLQRQLPFLQKGQLAWAFLLVTVIIRHLLPNSQLPTPHPSSSVGSCRFLSSTRAEAIFADSLVIADWWVIAERVLTSAAASYGSDHQGKSNRQQNEHHSALLLLSELVSNIGLCSGIDSVQLKFKAALQIFYGLENSLLLSSKSQPSSPASSRRSSSSLPGLFYSSTNTTIPTLSIFYEARILGSLLLNDEIVTGCGLINLSKPLMVVYLERLLSPLQSGFEVDESSDSAELFQSVLTQLRLTCLMLSPKFDVFLRGGRKYCSSFPSFTPSPDKVCAKEEYFSEWKFKEAVTLCKMFITNEFKNMPSSSSISGKSGSSDSWSPSSTSPLLLSMKSQLKAGWIYLLDLTIIANNSPLKTAQEIITAHMYLLAIFYLMSSLSHIEDCTRKPDEMVSACRDRFRHFFSKCLLTLETVASASASSRNTRMLKIVIFVWKCISKDLSVHLSYLTSSQSSSLSSSAATTTATAAWPLEASDIVELSNKFHALWKILELKFDEDDITFSTKSNRSSCDRAGSTIKPGKKTAPEEFDEFDSVIIFKGHSILTTNTTTSTSSSTLARIPLLLELYSTTAYSKAISEERGQLVYEALQTMISLWAALHYSNFGLDRDALILSNRLVESQRITILSLLFCNNDITMRMAQSHYQGTELMHVFSRMPMETFLRLMESFNNLVMDYEGEKNEFVWCMMIKHFLKTVLPEIISRPDLLDSMEVREQIGGNLYFLFGKQCTGRHLPWRIFTEFLDLLVAYILLDKNLDYLQQISSKNSSLAEATHKFCYAAINHSLFVVRIASSSYIGAMFRLMGMEADDDEDYQNLFQDAKTSLESISELNRTSPNVNDSKCDGILFFKQKLISLSQMKLVIQILILAGGGGRRQDAMRCLIHFFEEAQEIIGGFNSMELLCYSLQESDSFDSVEKSGSYRLTTRILDECLPSIVEEYGVSGRLDTFPFFMFGFDSQLKFLTKTCRLLIPLYVVSDKFDLVPDLAASIGRSTLDLLLKTAPYIMARVLPLMLEGEKFEANKMLAPVIKEILEPHKLIYASSATLENLVFSLLCLVHGSLLAGGDVSDTVLLSDNHLFSKLFRQSSPSTRAIIGKPAKPFFSASQVFSSLRILASIVGVRSIDQLFDANLILRVLNIYSEHVDCLVFPDSVCRVMDGLKLLFAICPKILLHVVPLRWLISILLRIIKRGGVPLKEGCSFILCVCKYAIESDHSHSLAPSLVLIITSLAQFMHHEIRRTSNLEEECRILSKTVIQLIQSSYKLEELNIEVQISMAQLDPDEALFDDIRESFNKMRASIAGEGGRGDGNNNIQVIQKLVTVANDFTNSKTALLATLKYIKSALRFGLSAFSSEKYLCIEICQYLIGIIHSHPKGELCHLALSCLGRLAPFLNEVYLPARQHQSDKAHTANEGQIYALNSLCRFILSPDFRVNGTARKTLDCVLNTERGFLVAGALDPQTMQIASLFIKQKSNTSEKKLAVVPNIFMKITQGADLSLLFKNGQERKKDWAVVLTNSIIMSFPCDEIIGSMGLMIEASPSFAVSIMPFVIYDCLLRESQKKCFEAGENSFRYILSSSLSQLLSTQLDQLNLELSICLIRVFECLVSNSNPSALLQNQYWGWLDVDYLLISRLAIRCKFYSSALFFCEIHAMKLAESSSSQSSRLALDSPDVFKVLLAANEHLHLADGFDGVSLLASNHNIPLDISRKYRHNGQWEKLFELEESRAATTGNPASMLLAMSRLGYHDLLRTLMNGLSSSKDTAGTLSDACYDLYDECVWRQSLWDLPELPFSPSRAEGHHHSILKVLRTLKSELGSVTATSYASIRQGFADWYSGFSHLLSHEFIDIEQSILSMMPLIEVEEALEKAEEGNKWSALLQMWKDRSEALCETYGLTTNYEISLAARSSCLKVMIGHSASPSSTLSSASSSTASMEDCKYQNILSTSFQDHLLKYCKLTRKSGLLHFSGKAIEEYSRLASSSLDSLQADLQRAKLLWKKEEWSEALGALKAISIKAAAGGIKLEGRHGAALKAKLLLQLAIWSGETRTENPDSIIAFYFDAQRESQLGDVRLLARTHYHLARYCDDQYQSMLNDESNSSIARQLLAQKEEELKICMKIVTDLQKSAQAHQVPDSKEAKIRFMKHQRDKLKKQIDIDKSEFDRLQTNLEGFLKRCLESYCAAVETRSKWDMVVFRIVTLWFANSSKGAINDIIIKASSKIPSSKFLVLMYQLSARLDSAADTNRFQNALHILISRMTADHPHHTVMNLFALNKGIRDMHKDSGEGNGKSVAAVKILENVMKRGKPIIQFYEHVSELYMELANLKVTQPEGKGNRRSPTIPLGRKLKVFDLAPEIALIPILTLDLPVDPSLKYDKIVGISKFKPEYRLVGGINMPKLIECIGTDGRVYKQLVKSNDDLRQDAVLSAIFKVLNELLLKNLETRKRHTSIRTYRVIPLSSRTGLLEWVDNTLPIGEYLLSAHPRIHKADLLPIDCRKRMNTEHSRKGSTPESKLKVFNEITSRIRPVFQHFFFENFKSPQTWFEKRLIYTRSVASNSMAGYIVGLGDRHAQNILIDKQSAEVIHIDLGIAFDQGRLLPTPEQVPFRLTRDIIDGFGLTGVEGAFRKGCEQTLRILRAESYILCTILDVFRYDPLYQWSYNPIRTQQLNQGEGNEQQYINNNNGAPDANVSDLAAGGGVTVASTTRTTTCLQDGNKEAARAVIAVQRKLQCNLSVECQVNELFQQAMDPLNMAKMFPGWQGWL